MRLNLIVPFGCSSQIPNVLSLFDEDLSLCVNDFVEQTLACPAPGKDGYLVLFPECGIVPSNFEKIVQKIHNVAKNSGELGEVWVITANPVLASDLSEVADRVFVLLGNEAELEKLKRYASVRSVQKRGNAVLAEISEVSLFSDLLECS